MKPPQHQFALSPSALAARTSLRLADLAYIRAVLAREPTVEQAWIYGSRARGTHRPGADIDLALAGPLTDEALSRIRYRLMEEGPLPYLFDITALAELAADHPLRAQIAVDALLLPLP